MIIDAREMASSDYGRRYTVAAALKAVLSDVPVGGSVVVRALIGPLGDQTNLRNITAIIAMNADFFGDRVFRVRTDKATGHRTIHRLF